MKRIKWKNVGILLLMLALLSYLFYVLIDFAGREKEDVCHQVIVVVKDSADIQFISKQDVEDMLIQKNIKIKGEKMNAINADSIETVLEKDKVILNAECYKTTAGDFRIDIWQRKPIFRVQSAKPYYVDTEGKIIVVESFIARVPIVTGMVDKGFAIKELKDFVLFLSKNEFWNAQIVQIDVLPDNEIILIPLVGDHEIELGSLENYEQKLNKLNEFYLKGLNEIGWGDYKRISIKYKNQVVCTKK